MHEVSRHSWSFIAHFEMRHVVSTNDLEVPKLIRRYSSEHMQAPHIYGTGIWRLVISQTGQFCFAVIWLDLVYITLDERTQAVNDQTTSE